MINSFIIFVSRSDDRPLSKAQFVQSASLKDSATSSTYSVMPSSTDDRTKSEGLISSDPVFSSERKQKTGSAYNVSRSEEDLKPGVVSDSEGFKIPTMPPPKTAVFSKSTGLWGFFSVL